MRQPLVLLVGHVAVLPLLRRLPLCPPRGRVDRDKDEAATVEGGGGDRLTAFQVLDGPLGAEVGRLIIVTGTYKAEADHHQRKGKEWQCVYLTNHFGKVWHNTAPAARKIFFCQV